MNLGAAPWAGRYETLKMTVDREMTLRMARAAQIGVEPGEVDSMMNSINDFLDFCAPVSELDCADTPDFAWKMKRPPSRRADVADEWAGLDEFKAAAPTIHGDFFRVPRIGGEE